MTSVLSVAGGWVRQNDKNPDTGTLQRDQGLTLVMIYWFFSFFLLPPPCMKVNQGKSR